MREREVVEVPTRQSSSNPSGWRCQIIQEVYRTALGEWNSEATTTYECSVEFCHELLGDDKSEDQYKGDPTFRLWILEALSSYCLSALALVHTLLSLYCPNDTQIFEVTL
jgi:hypothetical protein